MGPLINHAGGKTISSHPRPLVIWGNASSCAEKKLNPQIASCGKDTFIQKINIDQFYSKKAGKGNKSFMP